MMMTVLCGHCCSFLCLTGGHNKSLWTFNMNRLERQKDWKNSGEIDKGNWMTVLGILQTETTHSRANAVT